MAIPYLNSINLNGNEIQNFVVQPLAANPSTNLALGRKFFNSAEARESIYTGEKWLLSAYLSDIEPLQSASTDLGNRLAALEEYFSTSEDAGDQIDKWNEIVAFLNATEGDTLESILSSYLLKSTFEARKITAGTGLSGGGNLSKDLTLSLAASGVTAGTYAKVTVDTYGRVTKGASLAASDIPALDWSKITTGKPTTIAGYGITDAYTETETDNLLKKYLLLEAASQTIKGDIRIEGNLVVTGDSSSGGESGETSASISLLNSWDAYNPTTMVNYALSAALGYELNTRVTDLENGSALNFETSGDGNVVTGVEKTGTSVVITKGITALTSHQNIFALTIKDSAGTAQLTYTPNSKAGEITLTKDMVGLGNVSNLAPSEYLTALASNTTNAISITVGGTTKNITPATLKTSLALNNVENTKLSTWAGTNKITTVGTITSGTWNGTKIANAYLANNSVSIAGNDVALGGSLTADALKTSLGLGALAYKSSVADALGYTPTKKYAGAITKGTATEYTITHSLNTKDVVVMVYDPTTNEKVMVDVVMTTVNAVKIVFGTAPTQNYRVVVVG